jgi:GntR family transcriptional repressor for pyruvate dehydrogenase complex
VASLEASHDRLVALLRQEGYTAGDVLPTEPLLAQKLNVSRQSVRETLAGLQALGVIEVRQGARRRLVGFDPGAFGRNLGLTLPYTVESLQELLEVRRVLEVTYFRKAFTTINPRRLRKLRDLTEQMAAKAEHDQTFLDEDEQFHQLLYEGLDNRTLEGMLSGFWHYFKTASVTVTTGRDLPRTAKVHGDIVDAIELGDLELAAHRLDVHFFDVRQRTSRLPRLTNSQDDLQVG